MKKRKSRVERVVERQKRSNKVFCIVLFVFVVLCLISAYSAFDYYDYMKGGLWILVGVLLSVAWLMAMNFIKIKNQKTPVLLSAIAFILFVINVLLPDYLLDDILYEEKREEYRWNEIYLYEKLPQPTSKEATIYSNTYDLLDMCLYDVYSFRFEDYIFECENAGYTIDSEKNEYSFSAYNEEGYALSIWFDKEDEQMEITLFSPIEMHVYTWPERGLAKSLPHPSSDIGKIEQDSEASFSLYVGNVSLKDFDSYVNECIKKGYNIDYSRYEKSFYAMDKNGNSLHVEYKGNSTMYISVYTKWD